MTTGSLSLVVCHANSPTDGAFPSKQILSTSDSNGLSGIQAPYEINFRDQKVAGSNPVTSTKILSEDYNLQAFLLFGFARFFLRNPSLPDQTRISADKSPFGCYRMTTDKGGFMELRVWFWGSFSVLDVHWQKWMEKGGRDGKKGALVLKVHDGAVLTLLHIESALLAYSHAAFLHHQ